MREQKPFVLVCGKIKDELVYEIYNENEIKGNELDKFDDLMWHREDYSREEAEKVMNGFKARPMEEQLLMAERMRTPPTKIKFGG
jgi:hypothetical protein